MRGRLHTLDAMRGIAALVVVYYHSAVVTDALCTRATCNVRFGYLAVDMFFALSGFVISYTYDRRLEHGLGVWAFMKKRLVRLMPIYWLGLLIALPLALLDVAKGLHSPDGLAGTAAFNLLVVPFPAASYPNVVSLLRPAWSLFFELWVANLLYAVLWRHLRGPGLAAIIAASLVALVIAAVRFGSLDMGPIWDTFLGGFPRVLFSFFLGVALRRGSARLPALRLPSLLVLAATVATFFLPVPAGWELPFELACVALVYPALIHAGAAVSESQARLATLLGDASYALYLIHMPLLDFWEKVMRKVGVAPSMVAAVLFVVAAALLALLVDRFYDRRARQVLSRLIDRVEGSPVEGAAAVSLLAPGEAAPAAPWLQQSAALGPATRG